MPNFALKLRNAIIRCSAQGNPYLREHGVFRGAEKGLNPQILFDPLEKLGSLPLESCWIIVYPSVCVNWFKEGGKDG
jgi:hypothetical protein